MAYFLRSRMDKWGAVLRHAFNTCTWEAWPLELGLNFSELKNAQEDVNKQSPRRT